METLEIRRRASRPKTHRSTRSRVLGMPRLLARLDPALQLAMGRRHDLQKGGHPNVRVGTGGLLRRARARCRVARGNSHGDQRDGAARQSQAGLMRG